MTAFTATTTIRPIRVGFAGSRDYPDLARVRHHVSRLAAKYPDAIVVSGGCRGVDKAAELAAHDAGLGVISYRPHQETNGEWTIHELRFGYGSRKSYELLIHPLPRDVRQSFGGAAFYRNGLIAKMADRLMAYPSTPGRGTRDTMRKAEERGRPVHLYS
ncbi:MAG: SLOG family protein [Pseudonocardiaceae bacterium]